MQILLNACKWSLIAGGVTLVLTVLKPGLNRRYGGKWQYYVWLVLAVCLLLSPFRLGDNLTALFPAPVTVEVPHVEIPVRPSPSFTPAPAQPADTPIATGAQTVTPIEPGVQPAEPVSPQIPALSDPAQTPTPTPTPTPAISLGTVLLTLWLAGAAGFALYYTAGTLLFAHRAKRWSVPAPEDVMALTKELRQPLKLRHMPRLRVTSAVDSPMIFGLFRPCLLLPDRQYTVEELTLILRHELTHYRRHDLWYKALMLAANALHWFNPLIWLMRRQAGTTLELICDELALAGEDAAVRRAYCEVLLASAHRVRGVNAAALSTHFNGGKAVMRERFKNLLGGKKKFGWAVLISAVLAVALTACTFGFAEAADLENIQSPADASEPTGASEPTDVSESPESHGLPILAPEESLRIIPTSDGVETFLAKNTGFTSLYDFDLCYNITPDFVAENSDFTVFKYNECCESFLLYEDEIYSLGTGFGGYGITGMALADLNEDGLYELYFTFSWGSGLHRSEIGYFDPATRQTTVFDFSLADADMLLTAGSGGELAIHTTILYEFDGFCSFTAKPGQAIGTVVGRNGEILLLDLAGDILEGFVDAEALLSELFTEPTDPVHLNTSLYPSDKEDVIRFSPVTGHFPVSAINKNSSFPLLSGADFAGFAELQVPQLRTWAYQKAEIDADSFYRWAENTARGIWGSCNTEQRSGGMRYSSDPVDTAYGVYLEYLEVAPSSTGPVYISFYRGWRDSQGYLSSQPLSTGATPDPDAAIALARSLAGSLGLGDFAQGAPVSMDTNEAGNRVLRWIVAGEGAMALGDALDFDVTVAGSTAVSLHLSLPAAAPVTAQPPAYFLTPEEALYCINYARGLAGDDLNGNPSHFFTTPDPYSVELIWSSVWMYDRPSTVALAYTPVYKFTFVEPHYEGYGPLYHTYYVDAYTGRICDQTKAWEEYPSPYQFPAGYDPFATYRPSNPN